jgi:hypothetical protein
MKNPRFECSTDEESNDLANAYSISEDDEDMFMLNSLDYKLRARKAYARHLKLKRKKPAMY